MIDARGWIVVAIATMLMVTVAGANVDTQPDKSRWHFSCAVVRQMVAAHGEDGTAAPPRSAGVPEPLIDGSNAISG